jgi:Carboxypeptidase regulatory-like domain/TonB dependent receptor/TonB-dependent Receptor Plug Domain
MKTKRWSWWKAGPLLLLAGTLASPALAQVTAVVTGTVTDTSGAVLKDATVTATNQKTGVEYHSRSNDAGVYTITGLPAPSSYVVKAEATGFKTAATNPVDIEVGQTARVNVKLELGTVSETVEIVGVNPILQTENAVVGEIITGSTVVALPLNGRNFAQLALLTPGVQTHAPDSFIEARTATSSGRPYVNGQREQSNNFMLDGIDQNEAVDNQVAYYPSPDAIAEMRVETNNYSAEYGNVAGGIVSAITRSGSNEFHGGAFEFVRSDKFDANSWDNNRSGADKPKFKQHIFGATLGGPLIRNKTFFFLNYQGIRYDKPGPGTASVAPAEWRNGDFSALLGSGTIIRDPLTGQPFPGNRIPSNRISPIARAILADPTKYPLPNRPGLSGNLVADQDRGSRRKHQGDVKIDANLSTNDNLSIRGSFASDDQQDKKTAFPFQLGGSGLSDAQSLAVNWNHSFSGHTVNELRFGFSHVTLDDPPADTFGIGDYNAAVGIPGGQRIAGISGIGFGNSGIDSIGTNGIRHNTNNKTYQINEKLSLSRGRHFVSTGAQIIHYNMFQDYSSNAGLLGQFAFNGAFTGFGFADFLLDQVGNKQIGRSAPWTQLQDRIGLFVQDDFKVNSTLTLNLGLRWEYASPIKEKDNKQVNFDINTGQRIEPGGEFGDALYKAYYGGFGPRLGVAWSANEKTVIRGGYGIVQYQEGTGANCRLPLNPPFFGEFFRNFVERPGTLSTGFADVADITNVQLRAWQTDLRPQVTNQWNAFVERQVTNTTSLSVGYVGSRSTHVVAFRDINQALPGVGDPSTWAAYQDRRRLAFAGITGPVRYTSSDAKINYDALQASLRRRKSGGLEFLASYTLSKALGDNPGFYGPGWGGYSANSPNTGLGGDGSYNSYDMGLDYGPLWFSAKHNFTFSGSYDLPIGKGRKIGSDWSGVTEALLGGWNVSSILTVRTGLPGTTVAGWGPGNSLQNSGFSFERPDRVPGTDPVPSDADWNRWLDINAFKPAALGTFGNSGVGIWRGPGYYNVDFGLDKNFDLGGTRYLTFRIEAFNLLNHPNKGMPVRDITNREQFGQILSVTNPARVLEFAGRLTFDDDDD